jgi:hypothetical protein
MISERVTAGCGQLLRDTLRFVAARRIDDSRTRLRASKQLQLAVDAVARTHMVADVRPVEAGDDQAVRGNAELAGCRPRARVGGRGQRQPRNVRCSSSRAAAADSRAGSRAPFADAMRLVDRDQGQVAAIDEPRKLSAVARSGAT